jgi:hypothetical protein
MDTRDDASPPTPGIDKRLTDPQFSSIPRDLLLSNHSIDFKKVQDELGIKSVDDLKTWLTYLYHFDLHVNYHINAAMFRCLVDSRKGLKIEPLVIPTLNELAWLAAERYCDECPGSSYYELVPGSGQYYRQCLSEGRPQRFGSCLKFRENLASYPEPTEEENAARLRDVKQEFEE